MKSDEEQYSYISLPALWTIFDVEDPLVTMLEGKNAFQNDLLDLMYKSIARNFKGHEKFTILGGISWTMVEDKLHLHKVASFHNITLIRFICCIMIEMNLGIICYSNLT